MTNKQPPPEKFNEPNSRSHPDMDWFYRIQAYFMLGVAVLSIVVLFFILVTESGRAFASNPMLRDFILNIFPNAKFWVISTVKYKQEIVLVYFYYVLLLFWAVSIIVYLFIFNWRRMLKVQKDWFVTSQVEQKLCTFKGIVKYILVLLVLLGLAQFCGFWFFEPLSIPMEYGDGSDTPGTRGLGRYDVWNSYLGMVAMLFIKLPLTLFLLLAIPFTFVSMLMCFKKNTFYNSKN